MALAMLHLRRFPGASYSTNMKRGSITSTIVCPVLACFTTFAGSINVLQKAAALAATKLGLRRAWKTVQRRDMNCGSRLTLEEPGAEAITGRVSRVFDQLSANTVPYAHSSAYL